MCVATAASSRLVVYVPSISSIVLSKIYGRVYVFPFRVVDVFLHCGQGQEFYISLRENSVNQYYKHIERRHVNREEFSE